MILGCEAFKYIQRRFLIQRFPCCLDHRQTDGNKVKLVATPTSGFADQPHDQLSPSTGSSHLCGEGSPGRYTLNPREGPCGPGRAKKVAMGIRYAFEKSEGLDADAELHDAIQNG